MPACICRLPEQGGWISLGYLYCYVTLAQLTILYCSATIKPRCNPS